MATYDAEYDGRRTARYRNMCRFNSGFFFRHELLQKYRWYWRVEPNVRYYCDVDADPFLFMEDNNKVYSFVLTVYEISATVSSLWKHVREFTKKHPEFVVHDNSVGFISDSGGATYNLCHFQIGATLKLQTWISGVGQPTLLSLNI